MACVILWFYQLLRWNFCFLWDGRTFWCCLAIAWDQTTNVIPFLFKPLWKQFFLKVIETPKPFCKLRTSVYLLLRMRKTIELLVSLNKAGQRGFINCVCQWEQSHAKPSGSCIPGMKRWPHRYVFHPPSSSSVMHCLAITSANEKYQLQGYGNRGAFCFATNFPLKKEER